MFDPRLHQAYAGYMLQNGASKHENQIMFQFGKHQ
jgi:hypothetical protein